MDDGRLIPISLSRFHWPAHMDSICTLSFLEYIFKSGCRNDCIVQALLLFKSFFFFTCIERERRERESVSHSHIFPLILFFLQFESGSTCSKLARGYQCPNLSLLLLPNICLYSKLIKHLQVGHTNLQQLHSLHSWMEQAHGTVPNWSASSPSQRTGTVKF